MDHTEIKHLFIYLENNREYLNQLQYEFVTNMKKQYKWTEIITTSQIESLENIKESIPSVVVKE
jgi:hypothetical protein